MIFRYHSNTLLPLPFYLCNTFFYLFLSLYFLARDLPYPFTGAGKMIFHWDNCIVSAHLPVTYAYQGFIAILSLLVCGYCPKED